MNKLTLTRRGVQFFNEEKEELQPKGHTNYSTSGLTKRTSSLPQLISTASPLQKSQITKDLSKMTMKLVDLKQKGLRKLMIQKEDQHLIKTMKQQMSGRKDYLRAIIPSLVRKTRDNQRFGNLQSRLQRGRAYIDRLQHNFDKKFIFHPPKKEEVE